MAEDFQVGGSGNWWDTTRNRFESGASPSSTTLTSVASFGWPTEIVDNKARSSIDSMSVSGSASCIVFQDSLKLQAPDSSSAAAPGVLPDPNLQIMGLALSSQGMDWNQALFRNQKVESSFRSMLQEDMSTNSSFQQEAEAGMGSVQDHWRQKLYSAGSSGDSSVNEYKQIGRVFSLDQPQFSSQISSSDSTVTCQGFPSRYQVDSAVYGSGSTVLQGILGSDNQSQQSNFENRYQYPSSYGLNSDEIMPYWSKFPQFMRNSPPKQPAPHGQLHFSNNTPFWIASAAAMNDIKSGLFPSLQPQFPSPSSFDEKPSKNTSEVSDLGTVAKKNSSDASTKRPRNESPSPVPAFKVRKEKMGDRITALQQLVSPFGKTDTASVLSEAIEYIKFLHEQVNVLSTPYMKSGAAVQHQLQQNSDKSKDEEGPKQDLRSRGLCLVPISSTFPVTHETTVDFWTPTYGGTFR